MAHKLLMLKPEWFFLISCHEKKPCSACFSFNSGRQIFMRKTIRQFILTLSGIFSALFCLTSFAYALDSLSHGEVYSDPSLQHIGIRWQVSEDDNHDSLCRVRFRMQGTSNWKNGMDLIRTHPNLLGEAADRVDNRFAGSLFFLQPDTSYEIELTLTDPDGGGTQRIITTKTLKEMSMPAQPVEYYVIPGDGGGSGTSADPFQGLQLAMGYAQPGVIFHLAAGTYKSFSLEISGTEENPILIQGAVNPHTVGNVSEMTVIDGENTDRGVVTLGEYNIQTSNIIIENCVIRNGKWGVDAQNTHHILFKDNIIRDVDFGYYNRREEGWDGYQVLTDNTIIGRTIWPGEKIPSERGIDLRGTGNIVRYNRVQNFGDGVSIQPFSDSFGYSNDIYGNDIAYIVDDPIEIDYNSCNTRVWRNRVVNGRTGISVAPIYGGPVYIFRNEFLNLESSAYKMHNHPAGLVIIHNSSAKLGNGTSSDSGWQNTLLRNNVIMGTRYAFEEYGLMKGSSDDWDYDALCTSCSPLAKWDNVRYSTLQDLKNDSGIESHGVPISMNDFVDTELPVSYASGVTPGTYNMSLKSGVPAINAGQNLPNINDPFVTDSLPDCGAFEYGKPMPDYGPRSSIVNDNGSNDGDSDSGDTSNASGDDSSDSGDGSNDGGDGISDSDSDSSDGGGCFIQVLF